MEEQYYLKLRGKTTGPFTFERIKQLYDRGQLTPYHQVSADRQTWSPLESLEGIVPEPPAPPAQSVAEPVAPAEQAPPVAAPTPAEVMPTPDLAPAYDPSSTTVSQETVVAVAEERAQRMALAAIAMSVGALFVSPVAIAAVVCAVLGFMQLRDRSLAIVTLVLSIMLSTAGIFVSWAALSWLI